MKLKDNTSNVNILKDAIVEGIQEKKGSKIAILDFTDMSNAICSYFIICHGNSNTQVEAISRSIYDKTVSVLKEKPWHTEGMSTLEWVLLDYGNIVVHVFQEELRDFYELEGLWADTKITYL